MNENTQVLPDLDEALDFEVMCEAGKQDNSGDACENVAKWMGVAPCGHAPFMCDSHHSLAVILALSHHRVICMVAKCETSFCLHTVLWRHL